MIRSLLTLLGKGDWNGEVPEIWIPIGEGGSEEKEEEARATFSEGMTQAFLHRVFRQYHREKFGGSEEVVCDIAFPCMYNKLRQLSYCDWVAAKSKTPKRWETHSPSATPGTSLADAVVVDEPDGAEERQGLAMKDPGAPLNTEGEACGFCGKTSDQFENCNEPQHS